jgi:hypothetical protein
MTRVPTRTYVVYDSRAIHGTAYAGVMTVEDTMREAKRAAPDYGACVVYSYIDDGTNLLDERLEWTDPRLRRNP